MYLDQYIYGNFNNHALLNMETGFIGYDCNNIDNNIFSV